MSQTALIVEASEPRARALAAVLSGAGYRLEISAGAEAAIARLDAGDDVAVLVMDLDAPGDELELLRSFHCTHQLPLLLALSSGADAARTAAALADGVALLLDWAMPAEAVRQALQELQTLQRPVAPLPRPSLEAFELHVGAAGLQARIGLAQAVAQQGRRLLQEAVHAWLAGRPQDAVAAAMGLEQVGRRLCSPGLVSACGHLARGGAGLRLQQQAAQVRLELDGLVRGLGQAALQAPRWVQHGEFDNLPRCPV